MSAEHRLAEVARLQAAIARFVAAGVSPESREALHRLDGDCRALSARMKARTAVEPLRA